MQAKHFSVLLIAFIFIFPDLQSQDYQPIRAGEVYTVGTYKFIAVDSVTTAGQDSVFHLFRTLEGTGGMYFDAPHWLGDAAIRKPDGRMVFLNHVGDSIMFHPQAQLNDAWTLYTYPNADYIEATITGHSTLNIAGTVDSVKTLTLAARDSTGMPLTHPVNGTTLQLSQHYGFARIIDLYGFPATASWNTPYDLAGFRGDSIWGDQALSGAEIWDLQAGDVIHSAYRDNQDYGPGFWHRRVVIDSVRNVRDSLHFRFITLYRKVGSSEYDTGGFVRDTFDYTTTRMIDLLDPLYTNVPGARYQLASWPYPVAEDTIKIMSLNGQYRSRNSFPKGYHWSTNGYWSNGDVIGLFNYYVEGLGGPYYSYTELDYSESNELKYFKKGNTTWGNPVGPLIVATDENMAVQASLRVAPDPQAGQLHVFLDNVVAGEARVRLVDVQGRVVLEKDLGWLAHGTHRDKLSVSGLRSACYLMVLTVGDRPLYARFAYQD